MWWWRRRLRRVQRLRWRRRRLRRLQRLWRVRGMRRLWRLRRLRLVLALRGMRGLCRMCRWVVGRPAATTATACLLLSAATACLLLSAAAGQTAIDAAEAAAQRRNASRDADYQIGAPGGRSVERAGTTAGGTGDATSTDTQAATLASRCSARIDPGLRLVRGQVRTRRPLVQTSPRRNPPRISSAILPGTLCAILGDLLGDLCRRRSAAVFPRAPLKPR